jgi:hypothetical protein
LNAISYGLTTAANTVTPGVNLFVAGGHGSGQYPAVITSPDGYAWTSDTDSSLSQVSLYNSFITGMAYGSVTYGISTVYNFFVATLNTTAGITPNVRGVISSSTDGIHWSAPDFTNANVLNGIAYGMNASSQPVFVAVGTGGTNVSSTNLVTWKLGTVAGGGLVPQKLNFNGVAYGDVNGTTPTFVAVGAGSAGYAGQVIYYSTDGGGTWTAGSDPPSSELFYGVAYGNGQFVSVGVDNSGSTPVGVIWTSTTGATWVRQISFTYTTPTTTTPPQFNGITFAYGQFVAVGVGAIFVSPDGVQWSQCSFATSGSLNAVASGNNQYIAVGGGIVGSQLPAVGSGSYDVAAGSFSFKVSGPPGTFGVWVSQNLAGPYGWLPPNNYVFTSSMPNQMVLDLNAGLFPAGYYYLGRPGP